MAQAALIALSLLDPSQAHDILSKLDHKRVGEESFTDGEGQQARRTINDMAIAFRNNASIVASPGHHHASPAQIQALKKTLNSLSPDIIQSIRQSVHSGTFYQEIEKALAEIRTPAGLREHLTTAAHNNKPTKGLPGLGQPLYENGPSIT